MIPSVNCPNCGERVHPNRTRCYECGYVLDDDLAHTLVLVEILNELRRLNNGSPTTLHEIRQDD